MLLFLFLACSASCRPSDPYPVRPTHLQAATLNGTLVYATSTSEFPATPTHSQTPTFSPTPTLIPTFTPSPSLSPTYTLTPTPSAPPMPGLVQIFSDNFNANGRGWNLNQQSFDYATSHFSVNQALRFEVFFNENSVIWLPIPNIRERDFLIHFEAQILEPDNADQQVSIAFSFRRNPPENYFAAFYRNDGFFGFTQTDCSNKDMPCYVLPQTWEDKTTVFSIPKNRPIDILISVYLGEFIFFANGIEIHRERTQDLFYEGIMAIGVLGPPHSVAVVEFDNMEVSVPYAP